MHNGSGNAHRMQFAKIRDNNPKKTPPEHVRRCGKQKFNIQRLVLFLTGTLTFML